jgi:hypothetical protein
MAVVRAQARVSEYLALAITMYKVRAVQYSIQEMR